MKTSFSQIYDIVRQLPCFTKQNLAVGLGREGEDLNYWIKKLTREKLIVPLKKGFYISPSYRETALKTPEESELYWAYIANVLRTPSYVSLEYVMSKYSLIPEVSFALTSITLKSTRAYRSGQATFIYRNIKQPLFTGYQSVMFGNTGLTVRIAYPYKALFDYLYLKSFPNRAEMEDYLLVSGRINWEVLSADNKAKFADIVNTSGSKKMLQVARVLKIAKIL